MFDEVDGLPLHPLAVHASVVLIPLAALLAILFVIPRTRDWARWPLPIVSLGCVASVFVSRQSGQALADHANLQGRAAELLDEHEHRANQLWIIIIIFAVIAVVAFVLSRMANVHKVVNMVVSVVLVIGAVGVAYQTYRVGDIGSRMLWNPTGDQDFSSSD